MNGESVQIGTFFAPFNTYYFLLHMGGDILYCSGLANSAIDWFLLRH